MKKILCFLYYLPYSCFFKIQCFLVGDISMGKNIQVAGFIILKNKGLIKIGDNVRINSGRKFNLASGSKSSINVLEGGKLYIGSNVGISNSSITCAQSITIGDNVFIGADSVLADTDFHSSHYYERTRRRFQNIVEHISTSPIHIGEGVFIGMRVIVLKGINIGKHSIIGAGSVLSRNIPSNVIACGVPCRVIRKLSLT